MIAIKDISGSDLQKMTFEQISLLYMQSKNICKDKKNDVLKRLDTGIYDESGKLIGDIDEEDLYEED